MDSQATSRPSYARRTFLIDRAFQLKYTGILVLVGASLSILFGALMYQAHVDATKLMGLPEGFESQVHDRYDSHLLYIVGGITLAMTAALGLFGVLVTHRVAGPVYVIGRYLDSVGKGPLPTPRPLRSTDELQGFFQSFQGALERLRTADTQDLAAVEQVIAALDQYGKRSEEAAVALAPVMVPLQAIRDRKREALKPLLTSA